MGAQPHSTELGCHQRFPLFVSVNRTTRVRSVHWAMEWGQKIWVVILVASLILGASFLLRHWRRRTSLKYWTLPDATPQIYSSLRGVERTTLRIKNTSRTPIRESDWRRQPRIRSGAVVNEAVRLSGGVPIHSVHGSPQSRPQSEVPLLWSTLQPGEEMDLLLLHAPTSVAPELDAALNPNRGDVRRALTMSQLGWTTVATVPTIILNYFSLCAVVWLLSFKTSALGLLSALVFLLACPIADAVLSHMSRSKGLSGAGKALLGLHILALFVSVGIAFASGRPLFLVSILAFTLIEGALTVSINGRPSAAALGGGLATAAASRFFYTVVLPGTELIFAATVFLSSSQSLILFIGALGLVVVALGRARPASK